MSERLRNKFRNQYRAELANTLDVAFMQQYPGTPEEASTTIDRAQRLVTLTQIGALFGVTPQAAYRWANGSRGGKDTPFPEPVAGAKPRVWLRSDVVKWGIDTGRLVA